MDILTKEIRKMLIEKYPYLQPRDISTDKIPNDYDYSYIIGEYELPNGWFPLFLQMCDEIQEPLIKANCINSFRFSQIKEKFGFMRCYTFEAPSEVLDIINKYEYLSTFVCPYCGDPADCLIQEDYMKQICEDCIKEKGIKKEYKKIEIKDFFIIDEYQDKEKRKKQNSLRNEWDKYLININWKRREN